MYFMKMDFFSELHAYSLEQFCQSILAILLLNVPIALMLLVMKKWPWLVMVREDKFSAVFAWLLAMLDSKSHMLCSSSP